MTRKRCTGKVLAERRRGRWQLYLAQFTQEEIARTFQLYLAGFTQEEIAEKVGVHRSVVSRDLQWIRESSCPGESPDVQEACFIQMAKNEVQPARIAVRPDTPTVGKNIESRGGGRILERKEDLRPAGRWIRPPTEV